MKVTRIAGMLVVISISFVFLGLMIKSEQGYAYLLEARNLIEIKLLRKRIPSSQESIRKIYQEIGMMLVESSDFKSGNLMEVMEDNRFILLLGRLEQNRQELERMKVRLAALPGLMNKRMAFQEALKNLNDSDRFVKEEAIGLLEKTRNKDALPYLVGMIKDPEVERAVARAIINIVSIQQK